MSAAMLWPYGKCVECANKSDCVDSQAQIIACMSNGYPDYKPQTNAERIRSMSDEELAETLRSLTDCVRCFAWDKDECDIWQQRPCYTGEIPCKEMWARWLKKEAT